MPKVTYVFLHDLWFCAQHSVKQAQMRDSATLLLLYILPHCLLKICHSCNVLLLRNVFFLADVGTVA